MQPHNQMKPPSPHDRGQTSGFPRSQSQESCSFGAAPPLGSGIKSVATLPTTNTRADPGHTHTHTLKRDSKHITHRHNHLLFLLSLSLGLISDLQKHDSRGTLRLHREQVRFSFSLHFYELFLMRHERENHALDRNACCPLTSYVA